jgi:hypothetical protein
MNRWVLPIVTGLASLFVIVAVVGELARGDRAREWCGLDRIAPRQAVTVRADWTWYPPGYDCAYRDERGREFARFRAAPP